MDAECARARFAILFPTRRAVFCSAVTFYASMNSVVCNSIRKSFLLKLGEDGEPTALPQETGHASINNDDD